MPHAPMVTVHHSSEALSESRENSRKNRREQILDAAIKVFAKNGYHGSRVADIASEAGIAYGLVYHYFRNKEEILRSIFEQRWGGFLNALEGIAAEEKSAEDKLLSVAALMLDAYRVRPDWVKVLVIEIQRSSRFTEPGQLRAVGELFRVVGGIVRRGQETGELRGDVDPDIASSVFIGALEISITRLVLELVEINGVDADAREYYLKVARTVVDIFFQGVAVGAPLR